MALKIDYLTPHFLRLEMQCPCCQRCEMTTDFMNQLEEMRSRFGKPMTINSGFRCKKHNMSLRNSAFASYHLDGLAADISWDEFDAATKFEMLELAMRLFRGIGIGKTYLHVDLGARNKVWIY